MERKQFKFLRAYYDSISKMPTEVQAELYPAIVEYALFNKKPEGLSDHAQGVFLLLQPLLKSHITRCANGQRGGRKKGSKNKPKQPTIVVASEYPVPRFGMPADYNRTIAEEIADMKQDDQWLYNVSSRTRLDKPQILQWLDRFKEQCLVDEVKHTSSTDAKRHFNNWMRKVYKPTEDPQTQPKPAATDYSFDGGFGSKDV